MGCKKEIFRELLKLFPKTAKGRQIQYCMKFFCKYYTTEDHNLLIDNVTSYLQFQAKLNYSPSLQHYLYYRFYAYDYHDEFSEILNDYLLADINDKSIKKIKRWIRRRYADKDLIFRGNAYLNHLLHVDGYKTPNFAYAVKIFNFIEGDDVKSCNKAVIEEQKVVNVLKRSKRPTKDDIIEKLAKICINQKPYKISIALGIPQYKIQQLLDSTFDNFDENKRLTEKQFLKLKPLLFKYIDPIIEDIPEHIDEKKRSKKYRTKNYDQYGHKTFRKLLFTRM